MRAAVLVRLRELYAPVAAANYTALAAEFDALARQFATAASGADPESDATSMVNAPAPARKAWGKLSTSPTASTRH